MTSDPKLCQDLLTLMEPGRDERGLLDRVLGEWCQSVGLSQAVALLPGQHGQERPVAAWPGDLATDRWLEDSEHGRLLFSEASVAYDESELAGDPQELQRKPLSFLLDLALRLAGLREKLRDTEFKAKYRGVELEALYDVGLAIASTLDLEPLAEQILHRAVSLMDARRGALYLLGGNTYRLQTVVGGSAEETLSGDDPGLDALLGGELGQSHSVLPEAEHLLGSAIEVDGESRGLLVVADKESRQGVGPFAETDRRTLGLFANQAAIALENARLHKEALEKERMVREMELASEIQAQLLPEEIPPFPGFELEGWTKPARQVGGDYYDLLPAGQDRLAVVVADVTGKGVPAALLVSTLHSSLRLLLDRFNVEEELIQRLNRHLFQSSASNKFVTLLLVELNSSKGDLVYFNAGHNPALLIRERDGAVEHLRASGPPLGMLPTASFAAQRTHLDPGDLLCLYSDGITERQAPSEEEYGMARLAELLKENRAEPLPEIRSRIEAHTEEFSRGVPPGDDQTVVLVRAARQV